MPGTFESTAALPHSGCPSKAARFLLRSSQAFTHCKSDSAAETSLLSSADDPLVGSIAQEYLVDRAKHDKTAAEWTRRFAQYVPRPDGAWLRKVSLELQPCSSDVTSSDVFHFTCTGAERRFGVGEGGFLYHQLFLCLYRHYFRQSAARVTTTALEHCSEQA